MFSHLFYVMRNYCNFSYDDSDCRTANIHAEMLTLYDGILQCDILYHNVIYCVSNISFSAIVSLLDPTEYCRLPIITRHVFHIENQHIFHLLGGKQKLIITSAKEVLKSQPFVCPSVRPSIHLGFSPFVNRITLTLLVRLF